MKKAEPIRLVLRSLRTTEN